MWLWKLDEKCEIKHFYCTVLHSVKWNRWR